jgi:repressor of nif and glnA expression
MASGVAVAGKVAVVAAGVGVAAGRVVGVEVAGTAVGVAVAGGVRVVAAAVAEGDDWLPAASNATTV